MSTNEERLSLNIALGNLLAVYAPLLTQKQRDVLTLYYDENLSLGEIAEEFSVSRQNVHELITRSTQKLTQYEEKMGIVQKQKERSATLLSLYACLLKGDSTAIEQAINYTTTLMEEVE